ncbi:MAG TPA: hypothetical protein VKA67_04520, partial [Verrucomicrobiae bacterium]|nr:hypothetical protein [Verrucomicrobiae bacterium]
MNNVHTALEYAQRLGKSKRHILAALENLPAVPKFVTGQSAKAWPVAALPRAWRNRLEESATADGFGSVDEWMATPKKFWQPRIPLSELDQRCVDYAVKMQRAFEAALTRRDSSLLSKGEKEERGVDDYAKIFGHRISTRHWRTLFTRTLERDGGRECWSRL